jgi:hypothetical protein
LKKTGLDKAPLPALVGIDQRELPILHAERDVAFEAAFADWFCWPESATLGPAY